MTNRPEPTTPTGKNASRDPVAELRAQLAERDRQLANLTEQSLRVLDELANARQNPPDRPEVLQRLANLQELLADARARVRTGSRAILVAGATSLPAAADFEVVLWDLPPHPQGELQRCVRMLAQQRATVLMGPDHRVEDFQVESATWSVHGTPCRRPAHFWNEAMAATSTDVLVFVAQGVELSDEALALLAAAARADGVAASCPMLRNGDEHFLGRHERELMDVRPRPGNSAATSCDVPFASPEAFAVSRANFELVGPFDQDLAWDLALADWTARAAGRALRCVGVAEAVAKCASLRAPAAGGVEESDRLVFLARHRPHQMMASALGSDVLWQMEPDSLAGTIRAALLRLPRAGEMPSAVDLLVQQAQTVAGWKRLAPSIRERIAGLARELQLPFDGARTDASLLPLVERAQGAVVALQQRVANGEAVQQKLQKVEGDLEKAVLNSQNIERTLKDEMIARSNTIDALRNELLERERAIASLRQDLGHRQGEVQRFVDHLSQQQQEILRLQEVKARSQVEIERLRAVESEYARLQGERGRVLEQLETKRAAAIELERTLREQMEADRAKYEAAVAAEAQRREQHLTEERERRIAVEREVAVQTERALMLQKKLAAGEQARRELDDQLQVAQNGRLCAESESVTMVQKLAELEQEKLRSAASAKQQAERIDALATSIAELKQRLAERERELAARTAAIARLEQDLAARGSERAALERDLATRTKERAELERDLVARTSEKGALDGRLAEVTKLADTAKARVRELEGKIAALDQAMQKTVSDRDGAQKDLAQARQHLDAASEEKKRQAARLEGLGATLSSREEWIQKLLLEVQKRRLQGRELLPHEIEFLDHLRATKKS